MTTTRNCEDCQSREWVGNRGLRCLLGHTPRFYAPRNGNPYADGWGWRRRCDDFVPGEHVHLVSVGGGKA